MVRTNTFNKEEFKKDIKDNCKLLYRKNIDECDDQQKFQAVAYSVKNIIIDKWIATHKEYEKQDVKIVCYMSMEFLMGRALGNNMINLMAYDEIKEVLAELGIDINVIEDQEPDAALGNAVWDVLQRAFWILWRHWNIRHTAVASVTDTVCLSRRLRTVIRLKCRITG